MTGSTLVGAAPQYPNNVGGLGWPGGRTVCIER